MESLCDIVGIICSHNPILIDHVPGAITISDSVQSVFKKYVLKM
jgi:hypothetical protein